MDKEATGKNRDDGVERPREPRFTFRIQLHPEKATSTVLEVDVRWLAGLHTVVFESFCGFVKSKLSEPKLEAKPKSLKS